MKNNSNSREKDWGKEVSGKQFVGRVEEGVKRSKANQAEGESADRFRVICIGAVSAAETSLLKRVSYYHIVKGSRWR